MVYAMVPNNSFIKRLWCTIIRKYTANLVDTNSVVKEIPQTLHLTTPTHIPSTYPGIAGSIVYN